MECDHKIPEGTYCEQCDQQFADIEEYEYDPEETEEEDDEGL